MNALRERLVNLVASAVTGHSLEGARCRFCGEIAPVTIEPTPEGRWRIGIEHDLPACPEFAQFMENVPDPWHSGGPSGASEGGA